MPRYSESRHYKSSKTSNATAVANEMTEKELQETIRQAAGLLGYLCYHTHDSRRSEAGFPDLVIVGHGRVFFWELKSEKEKVSDKQQDWLDALSGILTPIDVRVVRPEDLSECLADLQNARRDGATDTSLLSAYRRRAQLEARDR